MTVIMETFSEKFKGQLKALLQLWLEEKGEPSSPDKLRVSKTELSWRERRRTIEEIDSNDTTDHLLTEKRSRKIRGLLLFRRALVSSRMDEEGLWNPSRTSWTTIR
ncbi:unnamed protein product [Rhizophagus irregularis]|nr:unnamed protein product [Rhizophagus irregularis]